MKQEKCSKRSAVAGIVIVTCNVAFALQWCNSWLPCWGWPDHAFFPMAVTTTVGLTAFTDLTRICVAPQTVISLLLLCPPLSPFPSFPPSFHHAFSHYLHKSVDSECRGMQRERPIWMPLLVPATAFKLTFITVLWVINKLYCLRAYPVFKTRHKKGKHWLFQVNWWMYACGVLLKLLLSAVLYSIVMLWKIKMCS